MHIGWDWASEAHDITIIADTGEILDRWAPTSRAAASLVGGQTPLCQVDTHGEAGAAR